MARCLICVSKITTPFACVKLAEIMLKTNCLCDECHTILHEFVSLQCNIFCALSSIVNRVVRDFLVHFRLFST